MHHTPASGGPPPVRAAAAVIGTVCALAAGGGVLAAAALAGGAERPVVVREAPAPGAWTARASSGPVSVKRLERLTGAPHGAGHVDFAGHVTTTSGADRIRVTVTVANSGRRTMPYSPGQLRLRLGGVGTTVPPTRPNPPPGSIAAGETLEQRLTYVVPAQLTSFALTFADLGRAAPLAIELGRLARPRKDQP
jgi:hypothetical protein